jgi:flavin reductase (DIM6/NTAB) family NADH-FMN oxidoreductase RutF
MRDETSEGPDDADRLRRRVLWALPTGLYVVGSRAGERRNLMTANWVMQIAMSPKLVAVAVESGSLTRTLITEGGSFSVSLLARSERGLVRRFVKPVREIETGADGVATSMQGEPVVEMADGLPRLAAAIAWLACSVVSITEWEPAGDRGDAVPASHVLGGTDDDAVLTMGDTRMNYGG